MKPTQALCIAALVVLSACSGGARSDPAPTVQTALYPGETAQMRRLIQASAREHGIPEALLHRVIQRESDYRADARNGPYWGLMQILPQTARTMGFQGQPQDLLDAETNLKYALKYLRGAYLVADGDWDRSIMWYARGYYYEAKRKGLLVATGLRSG